MRLDRFLSEMGVASRSEIKGLLKKRQVTVNGQTALKGDLKIDEHSDEVIVAGEQIAYRPVVWYMLNKPAGVVSAVTDARDRTVLDLIDVRRRKDLFPVGRLDKDTEGLLLITNDGAAANRLLSPKHHVEKTYFVRVDGPLTPDMTADFREGLRIGDEPLTLPAALDIRRSGETSEALVTITEGRFHQIKRMFHAVGREVLFLKRLSMGPLRLDESLKPGEWRELTEEEIARLCAREESQNAQKSEI